MPPVIEEISSNLPPAADTALTKEGQFSTVGIVVPRARMWAPWATWAAVAWPGIAPINHDRQNLPEGAPHSL